MNIGPFFHRVPSKDGPARAAACENTRAAIPARGVQSAIFHVKVIPRERHRPRFAGPTKATPSKNLARRNCQNNSKIDYGGEKKYDDTDL